MFQARSGGWLRAFEEYRPYPNAAAIRRAASIRAAFPG